MSNFAFLQDEFQELAQAAQGAEQFVYDYPKGAVMCTRQALESLVWWMYQYDKTLIEPYEPSLFNLLDTPEFLKLVPEHVRIKWMCCAAVVTMRPMPKVRLYLTPLQPSKPCKSCFWYVFGLSALMAQP